MFFFVGILKFHLVQPKLNFPPPGETFLEPTSKVESGVGFAFRQFDRIGLFQLGTLYAFLFKIGPKFLAN